MPSVNSDTVISNNTKKRTLCSMHFIYNPLLHPAPSSYISYLSHMKKLLLSIILLIPALLFAQQNIMTPELLLSLGRVSGIGLSKDKQSIIYSVTTPNVELN